MVKNNKGFTLVELLAVIVILAVILVIAVPSIMSTITESRKGALASSAKLIASSAETAYISNQTLGIEKDIRCEDVSSYTEEDYTCSLEFVDGKAKVTLEGKGKFEGMYVCGGTKEGAETTEDACPTPFEKDSWATIKAAVKSGNTSKYNVGDTRTIYLDIDGNGTDETYTLRIANNSHYKSKGECKDKVGNALASETACGFVIEFADIIAKKPMNSSSTNTGGWPASDMRTYLNSKNKDGNHVDGGLYDLLVATIGDIIENTIVVSGHGSTENNNFESEDRVYLLSTREVWGKEGTSNKVGDDTADGETITRQLDWYEQKKVTTVNNDDRKNAIKQYAGSDQYWWLRSAISIYTNTFYRVSANGGWVSNIPPSKTYGVSPAFRLG